MIAVSRRTLTLTLSLLVLGSLGACKREAPKSAAAAPKASPGSELVALAYQRVDVPPAELPLVGLDGTTSTLGQLSQKKVVVVIPFLGVQKDALARAAEAHVALADLPDVQILIVNLDRPDTDEKRAALHQQAEEAKVSSPLYVDPDLKLFAYINGKSKAEAPKKRRIRVPAYVLLTDGLAEVTFPPRSRGDRKAELREHVLAALQGSGTASPGPASPGTPAPGATATTPAP